MREVTLAAANVKIVHDKRANLRRFLDVIDEAATLGADFLVLPEVGLQGYVDFGLQFFAPEFADQKRYLLREAESIPGPSTEVIRQAVESHGMYVQLGMAESALYGNVVYNSTALIGPGGVVGVFRKVHARGDYPWFGSGEELPVFETDHGRVASLICYDLCFPELTRTYALKGAHLLLMSAAWGMDGHDRGTDYNGQSMDLMARATAFMHQTWLVVSNHCETDVYSTRSDYYGGSQIVDPNGIVRGYAAQEEAVIAETVALDDTIWRAKTEGFSGCNLLQDRRPELYGLVTDDSFRYASDRAAPRSQEQGGEKRTTIVTESPPRGETRGGVWSSCDRAPPANSKRPE